MALSAPVAAVWRHTGAVAEVAGKVGEKHEAVGAGSRKADGDGDGKSEELPEAGGSATGGVAKTLNRDAVGHGTGAQHVKRTHVRVREVAAALELLPLRDDMMAQEVLVAGVDDDFCMYLEAAAVEGAGVKKMCSCRQIARQVYMALAVARGLPRLMPELLHSIPELMSCQEVYRWGLR